MKKTSSTIITTGSISMDRIMNFRGKYKDLIQPDKLHVLSVSILIDSLDNSRGGTAANIAYSLALLGDSPVLVGSIGNDNKQYLSDLSKLGVDTEHVHVSKLATATFTVLTDLDDNQVGGFYPGAMSDITRLSLAPWIGKNPLVVISANDPTAMRQLVEECRAHKITYAYDVGQQVTNITVDDLRHGLAGATILFVNDYELGVVTERTGQSEQEINEMVPLVVTTLGAAGSRLSGSSIKKPVIVPALKNVKIIDPTGAGDAYRAGFLHEYIRGEDPAVCAELASVVASYAVSSQGTQAHTCTLTEAREKQYHTYGKK